MGTSEEDENSSNASDEEQEIGEENSMDEENDEDAEDTGSIGNDIAANVESSVTWKDLVSNQ